MTTLQKPSASIGIWPGAKPGTSIWGFISLGYHERMAIYALYNFARQVDDEADAGGVDNLPRRLLVHRDRIVRAGRGDFGDDPILRVLAEAMQRYSIPESELQMLVDGVEMDFSHSRYTTFVELREYCNLVASVVGRMCVRIFGYTDPVALERADDLGLALQLTNILRDVREDIVDMGRVYLPQEELTRYGIPESALRDGSLEPGWTSSSRATLDVRKSITSRDYRCSTTSRGGPPRACRRWPAFTKSCSRRSNGSPDSRYARAPHCRKPKNYAW